MISDGDLRRQMERHGYTLLDRTAEECMTREPVVIDRGELATRRPRRHGGAEDHVAARRRTARARVEGVLQLHDLWKTEMI